VQSEVTSEKPLEVQQRARRRQAPRALGAGTLCEAFQATVADHGDELALAAHGREEKWTWEQYAQAVRCYGAGLAALGVESGDVVCLMLTNRPEFNICDAAAMHLGAIGCSIYNSSSVEQIEYVLRSCEPRVIFVEEAFAEQLLAARSSVGSAADVVLVDGSARPGTLSLDELERRGEPGHDLEASWRRVASEDVLCLIYSSGTTGPPKAVELTHDNMLSQIRAMDAVHPLTPGGRSISFLPHAHVADRWSTHYSSMVYGGSVHCLEDPKQLFAYSAQVRPTGWGGVPRIWEKLKAALERMLAENPDLQARERSAAALAVGLERAAAREAGTVPDDLQARWEQADREFFAPLRQALGLDEVEVFAVGSAPTPRHVLDFFDAVGIEICEMWGLTECSSNGAVNPPGAIRRGTVGRPLPGLEARIADDGEILLRGRMVMRGYRNDPMRTAEAIDPDGWLHTGDIGALDEDGYLRIVDRKKELIINASGKNMSPVNIESAIKAESPLIEYVVAIGDERPYNVALVVLDPEGDAPAQVAQSIVAEAIDRANNCLSRVEQIKRFHIVEEAWETGGPCLTPTSKLRRRPIAERYAAEIDELYR
jgi:long-subunit acyl-CoA synthetase (AMP-forming)